MDPASEDRALKASVCFSGLAARAAAPDPRSVFDPETMASLKPLAETTFGSVNAWVASIAGQDHYDPLHHVALYLYGLGAYRTWLAAGGQPRAFAGYSLGIYVSLVAAGCVGMDVGVELVIAAGQGAEGSRQDLNHGMVAVNGLSVDRVPALLDGHGVAGHTAVTHVNTPTNFILTCPLDEVADLCERASGMGAYSAKQAQFPAVAHSPFMEPYLADYHSLLEDVDLAEPEVPLFSCVTAARVATAGDVRDLLHDQLIRPVRFLDTIEAMSPGETGRFVVMGTCQGIPALLAFLKPDAEVEVWPGDGRGERR